MNKSLSSAKIKKEFKRQQKILTEIQIIINESEPQNKQFWIEISEKMTKYYKQLNNNFGVSSNGRT